MPASESPGSSPPIPTPTSEEMEEMEEMDHDQVQDGPVKSEPQPDETDGDITMADVNPAPTPEQEKKDIKLEDLFADDSDVFADDSDEEFPSTERSSGPDSSADQMYGIFRDTRMHHE